MCMYYGKQIAHARILEDYSDYNLDENKGVVVAFAAGSDSVVMSHTPVAGWSILASRNPSMVSSPYIVLSHTSLLLHLL